MFTQNSVFLDKNIESVNLCTKHSVISQLIFRMFKVFMLLGLSVSFCSGTGNESLENQLYTDLFANYNSDVRPITGTDFLQQIEVLAEFGLLKIQGLDEKEQTLVSHGYLVLSWFDQLLQWNPADYNNATYLIVPAKKVWLPELTAVNSVENADELMTAESGSRVRIFSDGIINWAPYMRWSTSCSVEVALFPYDIQECNVSFANWMYTSVLVNFSVNPEVRQEAFQPSNEWTLLQSSVSAEEKTDNVFQYPFIHMKLRIKRNPLYFELNVLLPAILLSFLLIPMFILPVESGEKVSLGVTVMLAYSIFLLMMMDVAPRSGTTPRLTIAILICIVISGIGIFLNILIINIHSHMPYKPVPRWMKYHILGNLATVLCGMKYRNDEEDVQSFQVQPLPQEMTDKNTKKHVDKEFGVSDAAKMVDYLEFLKTKRLDDDQVEQNKEDWNKVARVLDRLCLVIYCSFFVVYLITVIAIKIDSDRQT